MIIEGILKTAMFSIMIGALSVFIVSFIYHIRIKEPSSLLLIVTFMVMFVASFLPTFLAKYFPTKKKIAKRIDEIGLQERISTMYEYRYGEEEIYRLQRQDALVHLKGIPSKQIIKPIQIRDWLGTLICLLMMLLILFLPYNVFAIKAPENPSEAVDKEKEEKIRELIEKLREEIDNSDTDNSVQEELEEIVEQLEEELKDSAEKDKGGNSDKKENADGNNKGNSDENQYEDQDGLNQAAAMDKAEDGMQDKIEDAISKDEIGEALQNNELTREFGEAISKGDIEAAKEALNNLKDKLNADNSLVEQLAQAVSDALEQSGIEPQDGLYMALEQFSEDLKNTSSWIGAIEDIEKLLDDDIEAAQSSIAMELEKQSMLEALLDALEGILEAAKDEALGNERPEGQEPGDEQGEDQENSGEQPGEEQGSSGNQPGEEQGSSGSQPGEEQGNSGNQPGEEQGSSGNQPGEEQGSSGNQPGEEQGNGGQSGEQSGGSDGNGNSQGNMPGEGDEGFSNGHQMNEGIYDPISGDVPYGDVYAVYFAKYLEALKAGEVPEELREIIEAYFSELD